MTKRNRAAGFTLVEVLVAVAIVATLVALSWGSLQHALNAGKAAASMSNLRMLASANLTYAGEHDGSFCPAQEPTNTVRWHGARDSTGAFDPTKGFLSPYLDYSKGVKVDPLFQPTVTGGSSFEDGSGGYGYNEIYIGGTPAATFTPTTIQSLPHAERTVMFTTTAFSMGNGLQEYPFSEAPQWVDPNNQLDGALQPSCHFRANGKALVAWCDGHVTAESSSQLGGTDYYGGNSQKDKIGWFGPTDNNGYWNPNFSGPDNTSTATSYSQ